MRSYFRSPPALDSHYLLGLLLILLACALTSIWHMFSSIHLHWPRYATHYVHWLIVLPAPALKTLALLLAICGLMLWTIAYEHRLIPLQPDATITIKQLMTQWPRKTLVVAMLIAIDYACLLLLPTPLPLLWPLCLLPLLALTLAIQQLYLGYWQEPLSMPPKHLTAIHAPLFQRQCNRHWYWLRPVKPMTLTPIPEASCHVPKR